MKKTTFFKTVLLLCALIVGSGTMWADDTENITFPSSSSNVDKKDTGVSVVGTNVSVSITKGTGSNLATNTDGTRIYNGNSMTFSSSTKKISKIVFTYNRNKKQTNGVSANNGSFTTAFTTGNSTASDLSATWEASNETTASVIFTVGSGSGNYALKSAVVTFVGSTPPTTCSTPTFSPEAGAVAYGTKIAISCATDGATIYYTTDGEDPTIESDEYDAGSKPTITGTTTIKAIAVKDGLENSEVGSAEYTIQAPAKPTFSIEGGMVPKGETLTLSSATGTTIRYTTDGTTPTTSVGTEYSTPITINAGQTIKAVAYDAGSNCSDVASYTFTVFDGIVVTFDATKDTGTSLSKNGVSFTTSATENDVFKFYKSSTTTFTTSNGKIKKIEFTGVSGYAISNMTASTGTLNTSSSPDGVWTGDVTSVTFTASSAQTRATLIKVYVAKPATPAFSVDEGTYNSAQSVTISCSTDGASIYYTTDGTTPTSSSTAYSSAISIVETTTLKAIAIKDGASSAVASATYTMNRPATPTFDVAAGVFDAAFDLHLATETDGATIYYTTDGSTPTTSSSSYSDKVAISAATTTIKAIAVKSGLTSDVASATYTYDARTTPTFTLSTTSIDLKVNETSSAVTLTTNSDVTPSFTCADSHVTLTGTGNSRTISANAAGTYTVTVSVTNSENYKDASGTITVTVTKKATTMVLTPSFSSKDLYVTKTGSLTGVPQYNSSAIAGAEVSYSSSNTSVATIASDGTVTFKKAGSTTLTASYAGDDEYEECEATYELELVDTTPQSTSVDITFGNSLYGTSYTGTDAADNGPFEGTVNNVTVTVAQGSGANLYITNSETRIYGGTTKGTITITAPTGYVMTKIEITKGSNWSVTASTGTLSTATWTGSASSVVFSASLRSDFQKATITLAPTVTISDKKFASYCSPHKLDFTETDVKAYKASVNNTTGKVTLTKVDVVPVGEGVILYCESAGTYAIPVTEAAAPDVIGNQMKGVLERTQVLWNPETDVYNYILQQGQFNKANDGYLKANRAYLQTSYKVDAEARALEIVFEDEETTVIKAIDNEKLTIDSYYDLSGRKVAQPTKGLYIVNGRKVVIK